MLDSIPRGTVVYPAVSIYQRDDIVRLLPAAGVGGQSHSQRSVPGSSLRLEPALDGGAAGDRDSEGGSSDSDRWSQHAVLMSHALCLFNYVS